MLAKAGCQVTAVESHPFVFYFVQASLVQEKISLKNLQFVLDNSLNYLKNYKRHGQTRCDLYGPYVWRGEKISQSKTPGPFKTACRRDKRQA